MSVPTGSIVGFFDERDDRDSMLVGGYYITRGVGDVVKMLNCHFCKGFAREWVDRVESGSSRPRYRDRARPNPSSTIRIGEGGNLPHFSFRNARWVNEKGFQEEFLLWLAPIADLR
jgi:hypothetical protein